MTLQAKVASFSPVQILEHDPSDRNQSDDGRAPRRDASSARVYSGVKSKNDGGGGCVAIDK